MESSGDHGVILFTLGTYFGEITIIQPGFAEQFAEAFRRLPHKVIWQMKDPLGEIDVPPNVKVTPWVPQNDLLGEFGGVRSDDVLVLVLVLRGKGGGGMSRNQNMMLHIKVKQTEKIAWLQMSENNRYVLFVCFESVWLCDQGGVT